MVPNKEANPNKNTTKSMPCCIDFNNIYNNIPFLVPNSQRQKI